ncbi:MAG: quinone-interacting membrane-bound oxidoreductase complex subunit QmoC [candidate division Zixibacteria bacterium]|nr:quinone-interacting membrane-bound oxidoreductase complex subunit QmoC [candidate division Zixibacteria bacterium]
MADFRRINPDLQFIREIKKAGGDTMKKCFQCATCSVVCNLSPDDKPFPRKEMIMSQWGQVDELVKDPDIWLCYQCNDCSTNCPRGAKPGDLMAAIRAYIYKYFAFPSFMGKALASPAALPFLLLIPALIIWGCIVGSAPVDENGVFLFLSSETIDFNLFLPHQTVDALFVFGNLLIFTMASIGFLRFWKSLKSNGDEIKVPFFRAAWTIALEVINHSRFMECDQNKIRGTAHILLMSGFVGAMITTGMVFLFIFIPHYMNMLGWENLHPFFELPLELPHPVKFLGAISGILIFLGSGIMVFRRMADKDEVGASGYADNLFLYIMFFTGLTGMTSWIFRIAEMAGAAYSSYFLHILFVYFLLWYMPYSKFAHMFFRVLALIYATMIGRVPRCETVNKADVPTKAEPAATH